MPVWRRLLIVLSVLVMAGGVAGKVVAHGHKRIHPRATAISPTPSLPADARGLVRGGSPAAQPAQSDSASAPAADAIDWDQWSPVIFRFGFSFFAGFCIAYALRTMLKVGMFVAGVILIAVLALQYAGLMNVDWNSVAGRYDSAAAWFQGQFASFKDFFTGHLPSAGAAAVGLAMGFLR